MLPCVDEHFPGPLAPEGTEEQSASRGSAPASLLLDANKPLTFKQVPLLVGTGGGPSAHFSAPRDCEKVGGGGRTVGSGAPNGTQGLLPARQRRWQEARVTVTLPPGPRRRPPAPPLPAAAAIKSSPCAPH